MNHGEDQTDGVRRLAASTPELDAQEIRWWEKFADVEERFCWVQTPAIQRFLRGQYLRRIVALTSSDGHIVELGCGAGWLCVLLAKMGASRVAGVDSSASQIRLASQRARESGLDGVVSFVLSDASSQCQPDESFDLVVMHGLLHHLTTEEIRRTLETARKLLKTRGHLVVFEPVVHGLPHSSEVGRKSNYLTAIEKVVSGVRRLALAYQSEDENRTRQLIASRDAGEPPWGPSPKELPFGPDELPAFLAESFRIIERRRCMAQSHLVAQELLLMEISHPWLSNLIRWPILSAVRFFERRSLAHRKAPAGVWVFEMFVCVAA